MDDDPMINDAGKHSVKVVETKVSLRASEYGFLEVNRGSALKGAPPC
jgi:hypothetical protein